MTDAAPEPHEITVPSLADLPGVHEGLAFLEKAVRLLQEAPERPAALDDAREAIEASLAVVPQSRPDPACGQFRRRNPDMEVCLVAICGRCAPLRAVRVCP